MVLLQNQKFTDENKCHDTDTTCIKFLFSCVQGKTNNKINNNTYNIVLM